MSDIDRLRDLLIGQDKVEKIERISERVEAPEQRSIDVSEVLPDSISSSYQSGKLIPALKEPVAEVIGTVVRDNPEQITSALFPIIGPAIRKSIMEALKGLSEQINRQVETTLTPKGIAWRFQAMRAGVPFSEFLMQKSLDYRVEQAYLIHSDSGLVIEHVRRQGASEKDEDAVSAMLTVIQDFMNDSFNEDGDQEQLGTVDMGDHLLVPVHGPHSLLAAEIQGIPPPRIRDDLAEVLEDINAAHGREIAGFNGQQDDWPDVHTKLRRCLALEHTPKIGGSGKKGFPWAMLIAGIVLALLAWLFIRDWMAERRFTEAREILESAPGYTLTSAVRDGSEFKFSGLRDPLAGEPEALLDPERIDFSQLTTDFSPYQSLETKFVNERVMQVIDAPESAAVELSEGVLSISGVASRDWLSNVSAMLPALDGVSSIDTAGLEFTEDRSNAAQRTALLEKLQTSVKSVDGRSVYFAQGSTLIGEELAAAMAIADAIVDLGKTASQLEKTLAVSVEGVTDGTGDYETNVALRNRRASALRDLLVSRGVAADSIRINDRVQPPGSDEKNTKLRRATVRLQIH